MSIQSGPLISTTGIWYAYFPAQIQPGDNVSHPLTIEGADAYGNASLFDQTLTDGVGFTHRATINVDVHAECEHEVAIERTLGVHNENAGVVRERGQWHPTPPRARALATTVPWNLSTSGKPSFPDRTTLGSAASSRSSSRGA